MTILSSEVSYVKPKTIIDSGLNGGRKGTAVVVSGARHSLFPRVTKSERINGKVRYRKEFWNNASADDTPAYDLMQWIEVPSNAGDKFYLAKGTHTDIQDHIDETPLAGTVPLWLGGGYLKTALAGGESAISLSMKDNDYVFPNGGFLHIANKIQTAQTVAAGIVIGDSVSFVSTTWQKITATNDITYPKGVFLGNSSVLSTKETTNEEWLVIAENLYSNENIGTGTGTTLPALSTLAHKTNGICQVSGKLPVVSSLTSGDVILTAYIRADGSVDLTQGDASAGQLNMATGVWTTPITWLTAPGSGKAITITYRERPFSYSGNDVTVQLEDQVANAYLIANTVGSSCVYDAEVKAYKDTVAFSSVSGVFNDVTNPILAHCAGAVRDTIYCTFTSAAAYTVTGTNSGALGTGNVGSTTIIYNPETGQKMCTISNLSWSGTILAGDILSFELYPSSSGIWLKEDVPPGTLQEPHNLCVLGYYLE